MFSSKSINMKVSRVFFIGFMGCGKSTIARFVAQDLKWNFIDMDSFFEKKHQCTINEYFAQYGEEGFRLAERDILNELCNMENIVVGTGGGAPCFFDNVEKMRNAGLVIYISVENQKLAERLYNNHGSRPLLAGKSNDEILQYVKQKVSEREQFYRRAQIIVDGESLPFSSYRTLIEYYDK